MSVAVHRTFVTLVLALVAALVMPLAAGAVVLPDELVASDEVDGAPVVEEIDPGLLEEPTLVEVPDAVSPPPVLTPDDEQHVGDGGAVDQQGASDGAGDEDTAATDTELREDTDGTDGVEEGSDESAVGTTVTQHATRIALGWTHSLYLDEDGQIWAWGSNTWGQLGNGTTTSSNIPLKVDMTGVLAGVDVVAVAAGWWHSMALDSEGRVYTWGRNFHGALGDGTTTNRTTPVGVGGLLESERVTAISIGTSSADATEATLSAALTDDGRVFTWGSGRQGSLGIGSTPTQQVTPALVAGALEGLRVVQIDAAGRTVVALTDEGQIFTWGYRVNGSMGNGVATTGVNSSPVGVTMSGALADVRIVQVGAGVARGQALSETGEVFGWGQNEYRQLANGGTTRALVPVRADMTAFSAIQISPRKLAAGAYFNLALGQEGRIAAWGDGFQGQLGNGSTVSGGVRPVEVVMDGVMAGANIVELTTGGNGALALADDGRVFAWGWGASGQLGNGGNVTSAVPVQVGNLRMVTQPADVAATEGDGAVFAASSSEASASVRWQSSTDGGQTWTEIDGATSSTYTIDATTREMTGTQFRAVFTSASPFPYTVISRAATLAVQEIEDPPIVTLHPVDRVRSLVDLEVTLAADAVSPTPMTVQWQSSADDGATWSDIAGATDKTHTFVATEDLDGRLFRAVFTNPAGSATTTHALLQVVLRAPQAHLSVTPTARLVTELEVA